MLDLSPEQEAQLKQFKEFTGYDEEADQEKVLRLLNVCNWNLQVAVARYFDNDFPTLIDDTPSISNSYISSPPLQAATASSVSTPPSSAGSSGSQPQAIAFDHPYMDLIPKLPRAGTIQNRWKSQLGLGSAKKAKSTNTGLLGPIVFILMLFPRLLWVVGFGLNKLLGSLFPNLFRILGFRPSPNDFPGKPVFNTKEEVKKFNIKRSIEEIIGEPSDLQVFDGEFNVAFQKAKDELKWLMCILVNLQVESSSKFVKTFLNNDIFVNFVKENDIILYIGDVSYPEAFEVGKSYRAYSLPYINLIAEVSASGATLPSMSVVTKFQNFESLNGNKDACKKLVKRLARIVEKYEPQLVAHRMDKQETELARSIRQQQDAAYEQSLLKDKLKQEEKKRKQAEEREKKEREEREEKRRQLKEQQRKLFIAEGYSKFINRDDKSWVKGEYTMIQLRDHQGQRLVKKFLKHESTFDIFWFVECKQFIDNLTLENGQTEQEIIDEIKSSSEVSIDSYEHKFLFDLISPMPRIKLEAQKDCYLEEIKALWPNGSLLIESIEEDSSDDE